MFTKKKDSNYFETIHVRNTSSGSFFTVTKLLIYMITLKKTYSFQIVMNLKIKCSIARSENQLHSIKSVFFIYYNLGLLFDVQ